MSYSVPLTVPAGKVTSTLTGFPVRVDLSGLPWQFWGQVAADGGNIRVRESGTDLPVHVVFVDKSKGIGDIFFRATLTTAAKTFTVDLVDGASLRAHTDPLGRNAVWADYETVGTFRGGLADATGKHGSFAMGGLAAITSDGLNIPDDGYAIIAVPHLAEYTAAATFVQAARTGHNSLLSYNNVATNTPRHTLATEDGANWGAWNGTWLRSGINSDLGVLRHCALRNSASAGRSIVRSGVQIASGTATVIPSAGAVFLVGSSQTNNTEDWNGTVAVAYLRTGVVSIGWLAAEDASWVSPETFYTLPVEDNSVDSAPLASQPLTIPAGRVSADLSNFVTRIDLADLPGAWWSQVAADGGNIRVRVGASYVPQDLHRINVGAKTGDLYVRASLTAATDTVLNVEATNGRTLLQPRSAIGRIATWTGFDVVVFPKWDPLTNRASMTPLAVTGNLPLFHRVGRSPANVVVHQGIAINHTTGDRIAIDTDELVRYDANWVEKARSATPLAASGIAGVVHTGDGVIVGNELLVGLDDYPTNTLQYVAVYDATTLAFKRSYDIKALNGGTYYQFSGIGWNGAEFVTVSYNAGPNFNTAIERWNTSWVRQGSITHASIPDRQGITFMAGHYYVTSGSQERVYRVAPDGSRTVAADLQQDYVAGTGTQELEGIDNENGHLIVLFDFGSQSYTLELAPVAEVGQAIDGAGYLSITPPALRTSWTVGVTVTPTAVTQNSTPTSYGDADANRETLVLRTDGYGIWNATDLWLLDTAAIPTAGVKARLHHQHDGILERSLWRNGVKTAVDSTVVAKPTVNTFLIGIEDGTAAAPFYGFVERVYIRDGILSPAWIAAEVLSLETPSAFYTVAGGSTPPPSAVTLPVWDGTAITPRRVGVAQADGSIKWAASVGRSGADLSISPLP